VLGHLASLVASARQRARGVGGPAILSPAGVPGPDRGDRGHDGLGHDTHIGRVAAFIAEVGLVMRQRAPRMSKAVASAGTSAGSSTKRNSAASESPSVSTAARARSAIGPGK
jgi:hypothetical protein